MMVMDIGMTAPAPRPCRARKAISAGMLQARPHRIEPRTKAPTPTSMIGLRPNWSESLAKIGMETAWASRKMENNQGNWANPPRSSTIDGTAVARIVDSSATSPTLSITAPRIGPRAERRPTSAWEIVCWAMCSGNSDRWRCIPSLWDLARNVLLFEMDRRRCCTLGARALTRQLRRVCAPSVPYDAECWAGSEGSHPPGIPWVMLMMQYDGHHAHHGKS
jgi:hypothetical protein